MMNDQIFGIIKSVLDGINIFFIIYMIGYSSFLFLAVVTGSSELYRKKQQDKLKNTLMKDYFIPVSIIVPAYNEEVTVVETVKSLLKKAEILK